MRRRLGFTRCVHVCRSPYGAYRDGPCVECQKEYAEAMHESYLEDQLKKEHAALLRIKPATDREWADHCDQVAQVVPNSNPFTFTHSTSTQGL